MFSKTYDVGTTMPCGVANQTDVVLVTPAACVVTKAGDGLLERWADAVSKDGDAIHAKTDDISCANTADGNWETRRLAVSQLLIPPGLDYGIRTWMFLTEDKCLSVHNE